MGQVLQQNKLDVVNEELDQEDDNTANAARLGQVKTGLKEHTERMQILQRNMAKNAETMAKREQLKEMLEKQCLLEEKRTQEQNKIAEAREKLLEMKMRELELQKAKMERTKREQEERKRATNDFMAGVEAELEEMEAKAKAPLIAEREKQLGAVPKQGKKGKGKKSKGNTPKVMSPEPKTPKVQSPEPKTPKVMSPEPAEKEKGQLDAAMPKSERKEAIMRRIEQMEKEQGKREKEKMTEEEVKQMVENVEGKCKTVKSDMADMAMTEQYLRTKQALLMAKKKEQEMKVSANIAAIREQEVQKIRDKVKCMQDLLASRKQKLKITEEILVEKGDQKKHLDKDVEKMKRRESYVEKELIDRKIFEKAQRKRSNLLPSLPKCDKCGTSLPIVGNLWRLNQQVFSCPCTKAIRHNRLRHKRPSNTILGQPLTPQITQLSFPFSSKSLAALYLVTKCPDYEESKCPKRGALKSGK